MKKQKACDCPLCKDLALDEEMACYGTGISYLLIWSCLPDHYGQPLNRWIEANGYITQRDLFSVTFTSPMGKVHNVSYYVVFKTEHERSFMKDKWNSEFVKEYEPNRFFSWREVYEKTHNLSPSPLERVDARA